MKPRQWVQKKREKASGVSLGSWIGSREAWLGLEWFKRVVKLTLNPARVWGRMVFEVSTQGDEVGFWGLVSGCRAGLILRHARCNNESVDSRLGPVPSHPSQRLVFGLMPMILRVALLCRCWWFALRLLSLHLTPLGESQRRSAFWETCGSERLAPLVNFGSRSRPGPKLLEVAKFLI